MITRKARVTAVIGITIMILITLPTIFSIMEILTITVIVEMKSTSSSIIIIPL